MKKALALLGISLLFLASCQKDDYSASVAPAVPEEESVAPVAPVPPALESIAIDLNSFKDSGTKSYGFASGFFTYVSVKVVSNWLNIFNHIICVPVEAYKQLIVSSEPVQSGKGWIWTVDYKDLFNQHYTVNLYGEEVEDDLVNWELRVSRNDGAMCYENFTWLTGWSTKDGRTGHWDVLVGPDNLNILVTSDWEVRGCHDVTAKLTYQLDYQYWGIKKSFNDSYIIYSTNSTDDAYDASLESHYNHDGLGFWTVKVEWNRCTGDGRVMSSSFFGDSQWHCWCNGADDDGDCDSQE